MPRGMKLVAALVALASLAATCAAERPYNDWTQPPSFVQCKDKRIDHPVMDYFGGNFNDGDTYVWKDEPFGGRAFGASAARSGHTRSMFAPSLPPLEAGYVGAREPRIEAEFEKYAARAGMRPNNFVPDHNMNVGCSPPPEEGECPMLAPKIGLAVSGGSFRTFLIAAGVLDAMDGRRPGAAEQGAGGLLQAMDYIAAESGGAWLLGSWYAQGNPSFQDLLAHIHLNESFVQPGGENDLSFLGDVFMQTLREMQQKAARGFNVSLADMYSGLISQQLLPDRDQVPFLSGAGQEGEPLTLSSLAQSPAVRNFSVPLPIMISLQKDEETTRLGLDTCPPANIWEWSIFESGTFAKGVSSFVRSDMLGNSLVDGELVAGGASSQGRDCVAGADNLPWALATATAAFMQAADKKVILDRLDACISSPSSTRSGALCYLLKHHVMNLALDDPEATRTHLTRPAEVANPFKGMSGVKGGEDESMYFADVGPCEQIPLFSLLQPGRALDVVFALDSTEANTTDHWPNGLALSLSAAHARSAGLPVPATPNFEDFAQDRNLTQRASFFGCYDLTSPAIVYVPNHEVSYASNFSYAKLQFSHEEQEAIVGNGRDMMLEGDLPECVACLLASRQHTTCDESGRQVEDFWPLGEKQRCEQCLKDYCWVPRDGHKPEDLAEPSNHVDEINMNNLVGMVDSLVGVLG